VRCRYPSIEGIKRPIRLSADPGFESPAVPPGLLLGCRAFTRAHSGKHLHVVLVRLTDPMLNGDLYCYLAGCLPARVAEEGNILKVEFTDDRTTDEELAAVSEITTAWRAAGHVDVVAHVMAA
jgi:hypothetical protein